MLIMGQSLTMVVKSLHEEDGQSIFEFIIFLPLFIFMFVSIFTIGDSINGSINQQKAVRRYFFYIYKGNSTVPSARSLNFFLQQGEVKRAGVASVGWREKAGSGGGSLSFATCYPLPTLFSDSEDSDCFAPVEDEERSNFVRIYTQFGLCGENYSTFDGNTFVLDHMGRSYSQGCTLQ